MGSPRCTRSASLVAGGDRDRSGSRKLPKARDACSSGVHFCMSVPFSSYSAKGLRGEIQVLTPVGRHRVLGNQGVSFTSASPVPEVEVHTCSLCLCPKPTFQWKIRVCSDLRKSDKEINWEEEEAGHGGRTAGTGAARESLSSGCLETSQSLCTFSSFCGAHRSTISSHIWHYLAL